MRADVRMRLVHSIPKPKKVKVRSKGKKPPKPYYEPIPIIPNLPPAVASTSSAAPGVNDENSDSDDEMDVEDL